MSRSIVQLFSFECHHRWYEKTRFWSRLSHKAYGWGLSSSGSYTHSANCPGHTIIRWRGKRNYFFGVSREAWRCFLKYHHIRGDEVGFGFCGKCCPWYCCGSKTYDHLPGCSEDVVYTSVAQ